MSWTMWQTICDCHHSNTLRRLAVISVSHHPVTSRPQQRRFDGFRPMPSLDLIPPAILAAFGVRAELSLRALAAAMGRDIRTLQRHREVGELPVHIKGIGKTRRHYVCTLADVAEFYRRTAFRPDEPIHLSSETVVRIVGPDGLMTNVRLVRKKGKRSERQRK